MNFPEALVIYPFKNLDNVGMFSILILYWKIIPKLGTDLQSAFRDYTFHSKTVKLVDVLFGLMFQFICIMKYRSCSAKNQETSAFYKVKG